MSNNNIEKIACTEVERILLNCKLLDPHINSDDKIPSWDGSVFLYSNEEQKKEQFVFDIPVQIKGTEQNDLSKNKIKFPVSGVDLKNYKKKNGTLFFVVYENNGINKVYFKTLTFIKLKHYLRKIKQKNTKSLNIEFEEFPSNNINEITSIMMNFANDMKLNTYSNEINLSDVLFHKNSDISNIGFSCTTYKSNFFDYILTHPVTLQGFSNNLTDGIPLAEINICDINVNKNLPVLIDNKLVYNNCVWEITNDYEIIKIGKGISISLSRKTDALNLNYTFGGTIKERIKDLTSIIDLVNKKTLTINNVTTKFDFIQKDLNNFDLTCFENTLSSLKCIDQLFIKLGVNKEVNYENISTDEFKWLQILYDSLVLDKLITFKQNDVLVLQLVNIANIQIMVAIIKVNDTQCKFYKIEELPCEVYSEDKQGEKYNSSIYFLLTEQNLIEISNINYPSMLEDIKSVKLSNNFVDILILFLLRILSAYDKQTIKDINMLSFVISCCDYLIDIYPDIPIEIYKINKYQALKREGMLTAEQKNELLEMANTNDNLEVKICSFLLCDEQVQAKYWFNKLDEKQKKFFNEYPVNIFW